MIKKTLQLGMDPGTASHRLIKDILFSFAVKLGYRCWRCDEPLTRPTFSVEHKTPWLNSEDPPRAFFDLDNIAFSHISCNSAAARRNPTHKKYRSDKERSAANHKNRVRIYDAVVRRERYVRLGH